MKQIPNLFTLINLVFGCIAIVLTLQTGETIVVMDDQGASQVILPERIWIASIFIFAAAVIDFLDGFLARLMKAQSAMGEQLDSLSDVVSFGVAPGMILYQLLRIGFARETDGLDISVIALLPAFIFPAAVAWRLAKFNISTTQKYNFEGVPSPAAALVIASFPLIIFYQEFGLQELFINSWFLYLVISILSILMVSRLPFLAMKFSDYSVKNNGSKYLLLILSVFAIIFLGWLAVPVIFILYALISIFTLKVSAHPTRLSKETKDITV